MFDQLSERLQGTLAELRSRGKLSEADIDKAMREVRLALLEADVNFKVVKAFTADVKARAIGGGVLEALNPGQQVVKAVNQALTELMGGSGADLVISPRAPTVILMAGLQGSGKTTACGKLAKTLIADGKSVAMAACDTQRPAAVEQLQLLGQQVGATVYSQGTERDPVEIAEWALGQARAETQDVLIVDTAGRLHVDADLMAQLSEIKRRTKPHNVLLVVDAMTGQDAVNVAEQFAEAADFDAIVMTKLDGDARGGAALSIKAVTGKPIVYASVGEKLDALERFHPDRMAGRILGMGDVLSLIEKAEAEFDEADAEEMQRKMMTAQFTLEDFLKQLKQVRKMGSLSSILGMMPGMGKQIKEMQNQVDDRDLDRVEAIILSMTPAERFDPSIINGTRRRRIAAGSGTTIQAVKQLLTQFEQMRKMFKQLASGRQLDPRALMQSQVGRAGRGGGRPSGGGRARRRR